MAGVRAPLFGLDASGSVGDAITFSKWKGRAYVRIKATPSNPSTPGQVATRVMMSFLTKAWAGLSAPDKAAWEGLAAAANYAPFNAFVKFGMDRWTQFAGPKTTPDEAAGTAAVLGTLTVTGGVRQFTVSQAITTPNGGWGLLVAVNTSNDYQPTKTDIVYAAQWSASPIVAVVSPMTPGTYYVRTAAFGEGGVIGTWEDEEEVIVT